MIHLARRDLNRGTSAISIPLGLAVALLGTACTRNVQKGAGLTLSSPDVLADSVTEAMAITLHAATHWLTEVDTDVVQIEPQYTWTMQHVFSALRDSVVVLSGLIDDAWSDSDSLAIDFRPTSPWLEGVRAEIHCPPSFASSIEHHRRPYVELGREFVLAIRSPTVARDTDPRFSQITGDLEGASLGGETRPALRRLLRGTCVALVPVPSKSP